MPRPRALKSGAVNIRTKVPPTVAKAVNALASPAGTSRAALVRQIFALGLAGYELIGTDVSTAAVAMTYNTHKEKR